MRWWLITFLIALAAPAHAVVGGESLAPKKAPWFVGTGLCGGTLIAPDRIATAAHCFDPIDMADVERVVVGGQVRKGTRVALPATWRAQRAGFAVDDIAIVQLDRPVTSVEPATLAPAGAKLPKSVRIVGRGQIKAPAPGKKATSGIYHLRHATLKTLGDADCTRRWKRSGTKYRNRMDAPTAFCVIDADGRAPLDSVCAGDSGGPLITGTLAKPVLLGVISWTGPRCGADRLPTVAAEVAHYRAFLTDPDPTWAPVPSGPVTVTGDKTEGATLTCTPPQWEVAPDEVEIRWLRRTRTKAGYDFKKVGGATTYTVQAADRGKLIDCQALGVNDGGRTEVPFGPQASVRIAP
jgi:secreted trypsin-like serine protease